MGPTGNLGGRQACMSNSLYVPDKHNHQAAVADMTMHC
jgi:hypothetical protein